MVWDDLGKDAEDANRHDRDKLIGLYIGFLAVVLAICSLGGSNAAKDAMLKNIEASNTWAFFQAKNARRQALRLHADEYEVMLKSQSLDEPTRTLINDKIASYKAQDAKLTSDPEKKEGLDQLWEKGKALEADRDVALKRDPYFDYAEALLQIAIVLASVAILTGGSSLLWASALLGGLGFIATIGGFTLAFPLPF